MHSSSSNFVSIYLFLILVHLNQFTVDNLRFARKSYEILTLTNSLTVLQTYRQAFLIPQLTLIFAKL